MRKENKQMSPKVKKAIDAYLKLLRGTKETVKIVCGEIDPKLFEVDPFLGELESALIRGVKVALLFSKGASTPEEAQEKVRKENFGILALKRIYPELFKLYWKPDREEKHFSVADGRKLVVEGPHEPYEEHETLFYYSKPSSQKKDSKFNQIIAEAEEINFTLLEDLFVGSGPKLKKPVDLEKLNARIRW